MTTKTILIFLMDLWCINSFAQSAWTNYTNDRLISDVLVVGDDIWVASQGGLTRTNMQTGEFQTYLAANSPIIGGGITEIKLAPDQSFWLSSENAGIFHVKNGEWINYYDGLIVKENYVIENLQILPNGDVWFFIDFFGDQSLNRLVRIRDDVVASFGNLPEDIRSFSILNEQSIFISNGDTIHRYDASLEQVAEVYHPGNSIINEDEIFREISIDLHGTLILPSPERILELKNGTISVLSTPGANVYKVFKDEVGNVYFASYLDEPYNIRLVKYDGSTVTYIKAQDLEPYPVTQIPNFRGVDGEGRYYAEFFNPGSEYSLFRFDENGWSPIKTQIFPLLTNYQDDVQSDCEGNLWFGSRNGVDVRYKNGTWEHFPAEIGHNDNFYLGQMTVDPVTCDVWFSNIVNSGSSTVPGIIRVSNGIVTPFLLGHSNVYDVEATSDGRVYFFSGNSGFGYIENEEIHYIDELEEMNFVTSIDSDSKGNIYLAAWNDKLIKYDGMNLISLGAGEFNTYVYGVFVDNDDLLWAHFSGGVKLFDGIHWTNYSDLWPVNTFSGIVQDRKGNYWVSTWKDGLYYWDRHTLQNYNIFNSGLSTNKLHSVALDPDGNLIVTQDVGATVLEIPNLTELYRGTGTVFFDYQRDSTFDQAIDILVPGQKIRDADRNLWAVTNAYGQYAFYGETPEAYTYLHELENDAESTTANPQSAGFSNYESILPDFGFWKTYVPDVNVNISNGVPVCNRDFRVQVFLQNKSPYATSGHLTLNFNDKLTLKESSIPASHTGGGQIFFEDLTIEPFDVLTIKLDYEAPGITGEAIPLLFEGIFNTAGKSFEGTTMDSVVCSFDPNDKKVEPTGEYYNDYSLIEDPLKYTIRFQNEGSYKAFDITIIDTLDQHLDPSTFELLASSHNVETNITTEGIVTFIFRNIDLPTRSDDELESQGFVSFTVRPDSNLVALESIFNKASIYFDFNLPIETNTTLWHVVDDLAIVSTKEVQEHISVFPNPTQGTLFLTMINEGEYRVFDATGRSIDTGILQSGSNTIQLDTQSGVYYLSVRDAWTLYWPVKVVVMR